MCTTSRRNFLAATSAAGLGAVGLGEIAPVRLFAQKRPATGRIDVREYTAQRPRFAGYIFIPILLWLTAGVMKLGFRTFRTFP